MSRGELSRRSDWYRLPAFGMAALFVLCAFAAVWLARSGSIVADFLSFWAAGHLTAAGHPSWAYDFARHHALEEQVVGRIGILPFPYPPPFLIVVTPFGLVPYWVALGLWIAISAGLFLLASRPVAEARFGLAQAAAAANFVTGQNGFLTSAIFIGGTNLIATRPFAAGAILGLLCFKPQLAVLLPVALIAGREWRAIAGGVVSAAVLLIAGLLLFGPDSYRGFLSLLPHFRQWLGAGRWPWGELASTFAMLRAFGVPAAPALLIHGMVALAAAVLTARAWALKLDTRVPILAAATLLIPPYLFTYDALLLTIPLGWLFRRRGGGQAFLAIWISSLLPVVAYFTAFPNTIPIAATLSLWALRRSSRDRTAELAQQRPADTGLQPKVAKAVRARMKHALVAAALVLPAWNAATAQDGSDIRVRVGLGAQLQPRFIGSDRTRFLPLFHINTARGTHEFSFSAPDDSPSISLLSADGFSFGPAGNIEGRRRQSDVRAPVGNVARTFEVGAFAQYQAADSFRVRAEILKGINGHKGIVGSIGADKIWRDGDRYVFSIGPRVLLSDARFERAYFGVSPAASLASGLPTYRPGGGVYGLALASGLSYQLGNGPFGLFGYARYERLVGDAGKSPIIREFGSRNQLSGGIGLNYTFSFHP